MTVLEAFLAGFLAGTLSALAICTVVQRRVRRADTVRLPEDPAQAEAAKTEAERSKVARESGAELFDD